MRPDHSTTNMRRSELELGCVYLVLEEKHAAESHELLHGSELVELDSLH